MIHSVFIRLCYSPSGEQLVQHADLQLQQYQLHADAKLQMDKLRFWQPPFVIFKS